MLSNVERFLVLYGVDANSDEAADVYLHADNVTNWAQVVSIRMYVVLRSSETHIVQAPSSYRIDGRTETPDNPADKRLYRVFSTTVSSRNR